MIDLKRYEGHTPGPWRAGCETIDCDGYIYAKSRSDRGEFTVAQVRGWGHLTAIEKLDDIKAEAVQDANARLIADSPAILAAYVERGKLLEQCIVPLKALYGADNPLAIEIAAELEGDRG